MARSATITNKLVKYLHTKYTQETVYRHSAAWSICTKIYARDCVYAVLRGVFASKYTQETVYRHSLALSVYTQSLAYCLVHILHQFVTTINIVIRTKCMSFLDYIEV